MCLNLKYPSFHILCSLAPESCTIQSYAINTTLKSLEKQKLKEKQQCLHVKWSFQNLNFIIKCQSLWRVVCQEQFPGNKWRQEVTASWQVGPGMFYGLVLFQKHSRGQKEVFESHNLLHNSFVIKGKIELEDSITWSWWLVVIPWQQQLPPMCLPASAPVCEHRLSPGKRAEVGPWASSPPSYRLDAAPHSPAALWAAASDELKNRDKHHKSVQFYLIILSHYFLTHSSSVLLSQNTSVVIIHCVMSDLCSFAT